MEPIPEEDEGRQHQEEEEHDGERKMKGSTSYFQKDVENPKLVQKAASCGGSSSRCNFANSSPGAADADLALTYTLEALIKSEFENIVSAWMELKGDEGEKIEKEEEVKEPEPEVEKEEEEKSTAAAVREMITEVKNE